ncbi:MAG: BatD family protein [Spirochaetes bacterium]|nr:BatD family protein [Spirochaetota bacterium]
MRNSGKIVLSALLAIGLAMPMSAAQLETDIDDVSIEAGGTTTLRVRLSGDPADVKTLKFPSVPGLRIEYSGMERSFEYINGKSWSGAKLLFTITGLKRGTYRIPSFVFQRGKERMQSREVSLTVTAGGEDGTTAVADVKSAVELSSASAYVGQPVIMRYYIMTAGLRAAVNQFNDYPDTKGFAIKTIDDPAHEERRIREGDYEKAHLVTFALIPAGPGNYRVGGGSAVLTVEAPARRRGGPDFFGMNFPGFTRRQVLEFETRPLAILPLPAAGRPDNFQGDIGSFSIRADVPDGEITVFEEKKIAVTVEGAGNLATMTKPVLEREVPGLKVIAEEGESSISIEGGRLRGSKKFTYTLIPEKAGEVKAGRLRLSFFNPDSGRYETAETKEIAFVAKGDGTRQGVRFDDDAEKKIDLNPLYFVLIALALAGAIAFVTFWERRRFRMVAHGTDAQAGREDHPEVFQGRDYIAEAGRCAERNDRDGFLGSAEKALDQIKKGYGDAVSEGAGAAIARAKDEIYGYRFGRGAISPADMKRLLEEIVRLKASR